jgi:Spo0E like sporulation regulatory protein
VGNDELTKKIELIRGKMISTGMTEGFTSAATITLSQMLDQLINLKMNT